jgi:hypothetical protein
MIELQRKEMYWIVARACQDNLSTFPQKQKRCKHQINRHLHLQFWDNSTGDGNRTRTNLRSQDFRTTIAFATTAELQFWGLDFLFTVL